MKQYFHVFKKKEILYFAVFILIVPINFLLCLYEGKALDEPESVIETGFAQSSPKVFIKDEITHYFWIESDNSNYFALKYVKNEEYKSDTLFVANETVDSINVLEKEGIFHIVWRQGNSNYKKILYMNGSIIKWNDPIIVTNGSLLSSPSFDIDESEIIHVVWSEFTEIYENYFTFQIFYKNYSLNNNNWGDKWWVTKDMVDDRHIDNQFSPKIKIDNRGYIFIVWSYSYGDFADIYMRYYDTQNWSEYGYIVQPYVSKNWSPDIIIDSNGNVYVFWLKVESSEYKDLYSKVYWRSEGEWSREYLLQRIPSVDLFDHQIDLIIDNENIISLVWCQYLYSKTEAWWGQLRNFTWIRGSAIRNIQEDSIDPYLVIDNNSVLYLLWVDKTEISPKIFTSKLVNQVYFSVQRFILFQVLYTALIFVFLYHDEFIKYFNKNILSRRDLNNIIDEIIRLRDQINICLQFKLDIKVFQSYDKALSDIRKNPTNFREYQNNLIALVTYMNKIDSNNIKEFIKTRIKRKRTTKNKVILNSLNDLEISIPSNYLKGSYNIFNTMIDLIIYPSTIQLKRIKSIMQLRNNYPSHSRDDPRTISFYKELDIIFPFKEEELLEIWEKILHSYKNDLILILNSIQS